MKLNNYKLWTALITPFKPNLKVDYNSLSKILLEQKSANNGLLILGSTGEALNISLEDRKQIVDFVIDQKLDLPIMVGVGGQQLQEQKQWIKWLESRNIDAYLMVTPIYSKPGTEGQVDWFNELMDISTKPVMLYNVPGRASMELSFEAVTRLKGHRNFWAIKEASGSVEKMKKYLNASGNAPVFCGDDILMSEFANNGSCGLISVASNTWPKETHLYVDHCLKGKIESIDLWKSAGGSLFIASNPVPAKALLASEKRIAHDTMMPPLSRKDLKNLKRLNNESTKIKNWYKNNK